MAINFNSFTEGTISNIQSNDYVVGFDTAIPGGERKWTVSTIANAVSGLIRTEMANFMNNTLTLGNYPYMEFGWQTAPNVAAQTITANSTWQTLNITSIINQNGTAFGTIGTNDVALNAGTYRFQVNANIFANYSSVNGSGILALRTTDATPIYLASRGHAGVDSYAKWSDQFEGQFTISSSKTIELVAVAEGTALLVQTGDTNTGILNVSTANAEKRVSLKLWKVG